MGRKLRWVVIDDKWSEAWSTIEELRTYSDIETVAGLHDARQLLGKLKKASDSVIDGLFVDLNLQADEEADSSRFTVVPPSRKIGETTAAEAVAVEPFFGMQELGVGGARIDGQPNNGMEDDGDFRPIGPLIALPLVQYFRGSGVVRPISKYWTDPRLIIRARRGGETTAGVLNGYVHTALTLIWAATAPGSDTRPLAEEFGERFSAMMQQADDATLSTIIVGQFLEATAERRRQLFDAAAAVQGLQGLTLEALDDGGEVLIFPKEGRADCIDLRSLFADIVFRRRGKGDIAVAAPGSPATVALLRRQGENLQRRFEDELARAPTLDVPQLARFCMAFIDLDQEGPRRFADIYLLAMAQAGCVGDATVPGVTEPSHLPQHLRRYLVLLAQLHILSAREPYKAGRSKTRSDLDGAAKPTTREAPLKQQVCEKLGIFNGQENPDHLLTDFLFPGRMTADDRSLYKQRIPFAKPLRTADLPGWQGFNLVGARKQREQGKIVELNETHFEVTALDVEVMRAAWTEWDLTGAPLPYNLDRNL